MEALPHGKVLGSFLQGRLRLIQAHGVDAELRQKVSANMVDLSGVEELLCRRNDPPGVA